MDETQTEATHWLEKVARGLHPREMPQLRAWIGNRTLAILAAAGIVIAVTLIIQSVFDPERLAARYLLGARATAPAADPHDDLGLLMLSNELTIPSDRIDPDESPCRGSQCARVGVGIREPAECGWRDDAGGRFAHCGPDI